MAQLTNNQILPTKSVGTDNEPEFLVDMESRCILVPNELYNIGVIGDHKCEEVFLRIPCTSFDGQSLTDKSPKIRYINAGKEYGEFEITEMKVENDTIRLGWMIDNFVTKYSGEVSFVLQFDLLNSMGLTYQWSTQPSCLNVLKGLDTDNLSFTCNDKSIYYQILRRVQKLEQRTQNIEILLKKADFDSLNDTCKELNNEVNFLKKNVVYIASDTEL